MKKLITLTFALFFTAGVAFGQNTATTDQLGSNNTAKVLQEGSGNTANINQGDLLRNKEGNDNFALIEQTGSDGLAAIIQVGDNNRANDLRDGKPNVPGIKDAGHSNTALIRQLGDNNVARAELSGQTSDNIVNLQQGEQSFRGGPSNGNVAITYVHEGSENEIRVRQKADGGHYAIVGAGVMAGDLNKVTITQRGINQDVNRVAGRDFHGVNVDGDMNTIDVLQNGNAHKAAAKVVGNMNTVDISQSGSLNTASSLVLGSGNMATITQQ